jgi:hypothetical protein
VFAVPGFDEHAFLRGGHEMLDAVGAFWDGLNTDRSSAGGRA